MGDKRNAGFVIQGHRGFRARWPENTLPGFVAALRAGADAIELDCHLTRDGVPVVCHDPRLDPDLTRDEHGAWISPPGQAVRDLAVARLRSFDVGRPRPGSAAAKAAPEQAAVDGTTIPTLADVFAAVADLPGMVDVELKTDPTDPSCSAEREALLEAVVAVAEAAAARGRLALRSFDWWGLDLAARRWPDLPLTWLGDAATETPDWRGDRGGSAPDCLAGVAHGATWAPDHRELTAEQVGRAHALGLRVIPWTVNGAADIRRLIAWGVDGVCTDDVGTAVALSRNHPPD